MSFALKEILDYIVGRSIGPKYFLSVVLKLLIIE